MIATEEGSPGDEFAAKKECVCENDPRTNEGIKTGRKDSGCERATVTVLRLYGDTEAVTIGLTGSLVPDNRKRDHLRLCVALGELWAGMQCTLREADRDRCEVVGDGVLCQVNCCHTSIMATACRHRLLRMLRPIVVRF